RCAANSRVSGAFRGGPPAAAPLHALAADGTGGPSRGRFAPRRFDTHTHHPLRGRNASKLSVRLAAGRVQRGPAATNRDPPTAAGAPLSSTTRTPARGHTSRHRPEYAEDLDMVGYGSVWTDAIALKGRPSPN